MLGSCHSDRAHPQKSAPQHQKVGAEFQYQSMSLDIWNKTSKNLQAKHWTSLVRWLISWELRYPLPSTFESMLFLFQRWDMLPPPKPNIDNCTSTMNADVFPIEIMRDFPASHVSFQGCNDVTVCFQEDMLPFETQVLQSWYQLRSSLFGPVTRRMSGDDGEIPPKFVFLWKIIEHRNINILVSVKPGDVQRIFWGNFGPFFWLSWKTT